MGALMGIVRKAEILAIVTFASVTLAVAALALVPLAGLSAAWAQTAKPFIVAINHEPDTLDQTLTRNTVVTRPTMENVVEPLVGLSRDGNLVPSLAEWSYQDGGKILEFKLRPGVKFHSGDPLTVEDIKFSHERMAKRSAIYQTRIRNLDHFEIVDDKTFRFVFKRPDVTFLPPRTLVVVSKAYFDRVGEDEFVKKPNGTGPYKFVSYTPGVAMELEAFDSYWGGAPQIKKVRFNFVQEDNTRVAMLRAGEADIILNTPFQAVASVKQAGFKTVGIEVTPTVSLQYVITNPKLPWYDVRVRRAIAHAVDADAIVKGLFQGIPKRHARFAPGEIGYDPDLKPYAYDPALAKKLLAEAGFPNGFDMPLLWWKGENTGLKETAEAVALYLKAVGINAQVSSLDVPQFVDLMRKAKTGTDGNWVGVTPTPLAQYFEPIVALAFTFHSSSPFSQYKNEKFDALVDQAMSTTDEAKRADLVKQATRILHDDIPQASLWSYVSTYAMKSNVDFVPPPKHLVRMFLKDVTVH